jgi:hypothetical protein
MRQEKILYARCGELELRLEPAPAPSPASDEPPLTAAEREKRDLEELLLSSNVPAEVVQKLLEAA